MRLARFSKARNRREASPCQSDPSEGWYTSLGEGGGCGSEGGVGVIPGMSAQPARTKTERVAAARLLMVPYPRPEAAHAPASPP
jgi:hypothetical protein